MEKFKFNFINRWSFFYYIPYNFTNWFSVFKRKKQNMQASIFISLYDEMFLKITVDILPTFFYLIFVFTKWCIFFFQPTSHLSDVISFMNTSQDDLILDLSIAKQA